MSSGSLWSATFFCSLILFFLEIKRPWFLYLGNFENSLDSPYRGRFPPNPETVNTVQNLTLKYCTVYI